MREGESNKSTAQAPASALSHMKQLDGLRAIAVLSVLYYHFYSNALPFGIMGVRLFFVLSGFLITGILLQCRRLAETGGQSSLFTLRRFYIRRFLRIFPLFYLVLLVSAVINLQGFRDGLWWHAAYLSNVYFAAGGNAGATIHFWSLSVEEQFYLIWPWLILYVPRAWLPPDDKIVCRVCYYLPPDLRLAEHQLHDIICAPFRFVRLARHRCAHSVNVGRTLRDAAW